MAFKVIISSATADLGRGKKQADGETRDFETCRFSPRKTQVMTASKTRAFGRSSDLQAFLVQGLLDGLPIYRIPNDRRFPAISPVLMTIFVPAHRCGAVPDSHRIPSRRAASAKLTARRKRLQYNVGRGRCQYYRMCFWRR